MDKKLKAFLEIVDLPTKSHLLNIDDKQTLAEYRILRTQVENIFNNYEEDKAELIAGQHRLFDLAKKQETELNELRGFIKIILSKSYWSNRFVWIKECETCEEYNSIFVEKANSRLNDTDFDLVKKVVEKYGKINLQNR